MDGPHSQPMGVPASKWTPINKPQRSEDTLVAGAVGSSPLSDANQPTNSQDEHDNGDENEEDVEDDDDEEVEDDIDAMAYKSPNGSSLLFGLPSAYSTNIGPSGLTDDEIFAGGVDLLEGESLLQVAGTHTSQEIIAKINMGHSRPVLSNKSLYRKLSHTLDKQSKLQGRPRKDIKKELEQARKQNGVDKRMYADIRKKSAVTIKAKKHRAQSEVPEIGESKVTSGSDGQSDETEDEEDEELDDLSDEEDRDQRESALRQECRALAMGDPKVLVHDNIIKVAGVLTISEIAELMKAGGHAKHWRRVSDRLSRGIAFVAVRDGKPRAVVKGELERNRRVHGVQARKAKYAAAQSAKKKAEKKAKIAGVGLGYTKLPSCADTNESDSMDEDEDPLGDLEEVVRRVSKEDLMDVKPGEPNRHDYTEGGRSTTPAFARPIEYDGEGKIIPAPFDARPVGYKSDDTKSFVPGFRVYKS